MRIRRPWLAGLLATVAALQAWFAHRYYGFLTGDEMEVLSEAFRVATDYDYGLWNARNAFVAHAFVAPPIWIAAQLGVANPARLIEIATIPFILASTLTVFLVHRLALRWTGDELAAAAAAVIFAFHWIPLGFGGTTYPRVIAMACIAAAVLLVTRYPFLAGILMGLAFADRFSEIVFLVPLLIVARRKALRVLAGALLAGTLFVGVHDWLTRGEPFSSLRAFAEVTLVERDFASRVRHQPPWWYLQTLPRWCALTLLPLLWSARRLREPWLFVLVPLAALSLIAHKELRYLQGIIPFLAILAGAGFAVWWRERRVAAGALLALSLAWNTYGLRFLGRESAPAVDAARWLGARPALETLAIGQLWAYGDRLYLGNERRVYDIGTPPHSLDDALAASDAAALYQSDITPEVADKLASYGYERQAVFDTPRARAVEVYVRRKPTPVQPMSFATPRAASTSIRFNDL